MYYLTHCLDYYQNKLETADSKDSPHLRLRERIRTYEVFEAQLEHALDGQLEDTERAEAKAYERFLSANPDWMKE